MPSSAIVICLLALLLFYLFTIFNSLDKQKLMKISKYEVNNRNTNTFNPEDYNRIIEGFINECFIDYQLLILLPRQEMYITDNREQEIISDLIDKVSERLSSNLIERLSAYYNIDNIDKVISDKIYIIVSNYVINHNREINSTPKNKG